MRRTDSSGWMGPLKCGATFMKAAAISWSLGMTSGGGGASAVLTTPGEMAMKMTPSFLYLIAYLTLAISMPVLLMQYEGAYAYPALATNEASATPVLSVRIFLSVPLRMSGRKALVVRMGPRVLVLKLVLKSSMSACSSGLGSEADQRAPSGRSSGTHYSSSWVNVNCGLWYAPLLIKTSSEPPVACATCSAAAWDTASGLSRAPGNAVPSATQGL